jgi:serine/threonine-protein kinase
VRDIGDVRLALDGAFDSGPNYPSDRFAPAARLRWQMFAAFGAAAMIIMGMTAAITWWYSRTAAVRVVRTAIPTSEEHVLRVRGLGSDVAMSSDGLRIAYRGQNQLLLRTLDRDNPTILSSGNVDPTALFFSPDGQWFGFFDGAALKKVPVTGGAPTTVVDVEGGPRGATWGVDGTVVYATANTAEGLQSVASDGGPPRVLTTPAGERGEADTSGQNSCPAAKRCCSRLPP